MIDFKYEMPEYVEYDGVRYGINTDFRVWINLEKIFYSDTSWTEKMVELFILCYKDSLPPNAETAMRLLVDFYCGGNNSFVNDRKKRGSHIRVYDFEYDAELFYAAFIQQYGIDLTKEKLHWWKFLALFRPLAQDTKLFSVMQWRAIDLSDISDKNRKEHFKKLKSIYRLPSRYSEDIDAELAEVISQMML